MFGKSMGKAMQKMAQKTSRPMAKKAPAPQMAKQMARPAAKPKSQMMPANQAFKAAQKLPGGLLPSGLSNTPTDALNAYNGAMQKTMAAQKTMSKGVPSNSIANVGNAGFKRAFAAPQGVQSAMNAGPKLGGLMGAMSGAGAPQGQRTQSGSMASLGGAATGMLKPFGAKKGGKVKGFRDGGIYTADMGQPPQDIDGGSAPMKKPMPKKSEAKKPATKLRGEGVRKMPTPPKKEKMYAKGGSIDGCAVKGKTKCKIY